MPTIRFPRLAGIALVLVLGVPGCGSREAPPLSAAERQQAEALLDETYNGIWGTPEQRDAARYLGWRVMTDPIAACMADAGFQYYRYFRPAWAGHQTLGQTGGWLGHLELRQSDLALAAAEQLHEEAARDEEGPAYVQEPEYKSALPTCEGDMGDPDSIAPPPGAQELSAALRQLISAAEAEVGPLDSYAECMQSAGFNLSGTGEQGASAVSLFLRGQMPLPPLPGTAASPAWTQFLAFEGRVLDADKACRRAGHDEALDRLAPKLTTFAAEHAEELDDISADWAELEQRAERRGYVPV